MDHLHEPKSWYCFQKCGCVLTSSRHPWVRRGIALSGEYENICDKHRPVRHEKNDDRPFAWYRPTDGDQEPEFRTSVPPEGHGWLPVPAKLSEATPHQQENRSET